MFTETMKESINILISMRKKADVTQPYLFSRPRPHTKALKGTAAVRRYSIEAGLKKSYFCQLKNGKEAVSYFSAGFKPE